MIGQPFVSFNLFSDSLKIWDSLVSVNELKKNMNLNSEIKSIVFADSVIIKFRIADN